jgi:putative membrane protein
MKGRLMAVALLMSSPALTHASTPSDGGHGDRAEQRASPRLSAQDRRFLQTAAAINLAQIDLAAVAMQQGKTDRVRNFSQKMIDVHAKADDRLQQIATRAGVSLPTKLSDEQRTTEDRLWDTPGHDFDRAYLHVAKSGERQAISVFRKEAKHGRDPALKSFAKRTLPTLEQHQRLASRPSSKM